jgi:endogenous inhibitor of DNA gyrase (YacG/DUF329 family)
VAVTVPVHSGDVGRGLAARVLEGCRLHRRGISQAAVKMVLIMVSESGSSSNGSWLLACLILHQVGCSPRVLASPPTSPGRRRQECPAGPRDRSPSRTSTGAPHGTVPAGTGPPDLAAHTGCSTDGLLLTSAVGRISQVECAHRRSDRCRLWPERRRRGGAGPRKRLNGEAGGMRLTIVKCPTCGKPVAWIPEERWRPFCSERCKLIDLGQWAEERYRIPSRESPPTDSGSDRPEDP